MAVSRLLQLDCRLIGHLTKESGVTIEIADRTDGKGAHALFMEFGVGRVEGLSVKQMVVLAPGDYQFRGTYKADIVSQRGLQWRVVCASKAKPVIGESPIDHRR